MIISRTPLRVSFAGGGTDLPSFYRHNDYGAVLSSSVDSYLYVMVKRHSPLTNERIRLNYSESELVEDIDDIRNDIIRECLRFLEIDDRIYISTIADVPASTGLGSSSSCCVGLLNALYAYKGVGPSRGRLAEEAAHIELDILKRPMGKQDHYAAAYGGLNVFRFNADESVTVTPVNVPVSVINAAYGCLLSFWTGMTRGSHEVLREQDGNHEKNRAMLIRMRDQVDALRAVFQAQPFSVRAFGALIHENWTMKSELASGVSNARIDSLYKLALDHGAYGGKVSGAGGGGFLNIVAEPARHDAIRRALSAEGLVPYRFNGDASGTTVASIG